MGTPPSERNPVERLAEEFIERRRRGEEPSVEEYAARHPEWADEIRELFPALVLMESAREEAPGTEGVWIAGRKVSAFGDYRLIREVGRGGMGVVYEAEQISLGRRVALKVLPFGSRTEPGLLERFRREARAAARLHHTNIVPIYGVGEVGGSHYYAMQFIWGLGLDEVLAELRRRDQRSLSEERARSGSDMGSPATDPDSSLLALQLLSGAFGDGVYSAPTSRAARAAGSGARAAGSGDTAVLRPPALEAGSPKGGQAVLGREGPLALGPAGGELSELASSAPKYFRSVSRIGLQVAEALAYAHAQGTLHRDIKPSNLILDTAGTIWVTDFGLAKSAFEADITFTGDVVGTLRYMAPERFQGISDERCDIYGLGLTLYEMVSLRPAYDAEGKAELLEKIARGAVPPLRRVRPETPRDLETIVMKAIEREPSDRYQSARAMADDLRAFLEDRPIRARPCPWIAYAAKWCRRNPVVASLGSAVALLLVAIAVGSAVFAVRIARERDAAVTERNRAERAETERGLGLIDAALTAVPETVPHILSSLRAWDGRSSALPIIRRKFHEADASPLLRLRAAVLLSVLGEPQTEFLVRSIAGAPPRECGNLVLGLREARAEAVERLRALAAAEADPERRARCAIVLLELGDVGAARAMLSFGEDQSLRTRFASTFASWRGDLAHLAEELEREEDPAFRSGVSGALGSVERDSVGLGVRERLGAALSRIYAEDPNGAVHSAAGRALRAWGLPLPSVEPSRDPPPGRSWFRNRQGMTFVRIAGGFSRQGDPAVPLGAPRAAYLSRPVFVSDREVTVGLFERFVEDESYDRSARPLGWRADRGLGVSDDCPVTRVSWEDAVLFSNWLSAREGRRPCYSRGEDGRWRCDFDAGGYRLPTEAEWEHSCRAGTTTPFFTGTSSESILAYANAGGAELRPGGELLPNAIGAFDMLGNVWEWCWDGYTVSPPRFSIDPAGEEGNRERVVRGGSFVSWAFDFRSARRYHAAQERREPTIGFRVVLAGEPVRWEDTLAELEAAAANDPSLSEDLWRAIYFRRVQGGDPSAGEAAIARAVERRPDDALLRIEHARALLDACRREEAEREFAAACAGRDPEDDWFAGHWWVAGPYPGSLAQAFPPESLADLCPARAAASGASPRAEDGAAVSWRPAFPDGDGTIHLDGMFDYAQHISAYACAFIYSSRDRHLLLSLGSDDTVRVWLDGELVHEYATLRAFAADQDSVPIRVHAGWNRLLAKVVNETDDHKFQARFSGSPILTARALSRRGAHAEAREVLRRALEVREDPEVERAYRSLGTGSVAEDRESVEARVRSGGARIARTGFWAVGPYPPDLDERCPPEDDPDPSRPVAGASPGEELRWRYVVPDEEGVIHLDEVFDGAPYISAYVFAWAYSAEDAEVTFLMGSDDGMRLSVGGRIVHEAPKPRLLAIDQDRAAVTLRAGWNPILAKVANSTAKHEFQFRISEDPADLALAKGGPRAAVSSRLEEWGDFNESDPRYWRERGESEAQGGRWKAAASAFERSISLQPDPSVAGSLALSCLAIGDGSGYARAGDELVLGLGSASSGSRGAARALWIASLDPAGRIELDGLSRAVESSLRPEAARPALASAALGAAAFRKGRFAEAAAFLREAESKGDPSPPAACLRYLLALSFERLGAAGEARAWLEKAREWREGALEGDAREATPGGGPREAAARAARGEADAAGEGGLSWEERLAVELLAREAEAAFSRASEGRSG